MRFYYFIFLLLFIRFGYSDQWQQVLNLRGTWRFEIGDNPAWAKPDFNDDSWTKIHVPDSWENEGFPGFDGYAWYRTSFTLPNYESEDNLYLQLGYIDDIDQVYLNGTLVGSSGSFPPDYRTAYNLFRNYPIPASILNFGKENVLAVRVYDDQLVGGIVHGNVGIYRQKNQMKIILNLTGEWKFKIGDDLSWENQDVDDSQWNSILVPGYWETQGYPDYNGFAWYRKKVVLPKEFENEQLILILGRIDDIDECYLNGYRIGSTGRMKPHPEDIHFSSEYGEFRAYYLPSSEIQYGRENTIAVRVYDGYIDGGIYQGPIGITTRKNYLEWRNQQGKDKFDIFDKLFGN